MFSVREFSSSHLRYLAKLSKKRYPAYAHEHDHDREHEHEHQHAHEQMYVGENLFGEIQM